MIDLNAWLSVYLEKLNQTFGKRIWFVGLQGSYGRGEATENSDIDLVVILDRLSPQDIASYRAMLDTLAHRELACGFLAGREELMHWEPSDLFQFCHDTTPMVGSLQTVLDMVDDAAVERAIWTGACNLYHGCVHNMVYRRSAKSLRGLYKAATFVLRAAVYQRTGIFCRRLVELNEQADEKEREIIAAYSEMNRQEETDFDKYAKILFAWVQEMITQRENN